MKGSYGKLRLFGLAALLVSACNQQPRPTAPRQLTIEEKHRQRFAEEQQRAKNAEEERRDAIRRDNEMAMAVDQIANQIRAALKEGKTQERTVKDATPTANEFIAGKPLVVPRDFQELVTIPPEWDRARTMAEVGTIVKVERAQKEIKSYVEIDDAGNIVYLKNSLDPLTLKPVPSRVASFWKTYRIVLFDVPNQQVRANLRFDGEDDRPELTDVRGKVQIKDIFAGRYNRDPKRRVQEYLSKLPLR